MCHCQNNSSHLGAQPRLNPHVPLIGDKTCTVSSVITVTHTLSSHASSHFVGVNLWLMSHLEMFKDQPQRGAGRNPSFQLVSRAEMEISKCRATADPAEGEAHVIVCQLLASAYVCVRVKETCVGFFTICTSRVPAIISSGRHWCLLNETWLNKRPPCIWFCLCRAGRHKISFYLIFHT